MSYERFSAARVPLIGVNLAGTRDGYARKVETAVETNCQRIDPVCGLAEIRGGGQLRINRLRDWNPLGHSSRHNNPRHQHPNNQTHPPGRPKLHRTPNVTDL